METILHHVAQYLWSQSWQIALLIGAVAAVTWLLRSHSAHVRYLLWLLVLAKCLVPPAFNVPLPILPRAVQAPPQESLATEPAKSMSHDITMAAVPPEFHVPIDTAGPTAGSFKDISVQQAMTLLWLLGLIVFLIAALAKAVRTQCRLGRWRRELPSRLQTDVDALLRSFAIRIDTYGRDKFLTAYGTLRNSKEEHTREENMKALERIYGKPLQTLQQEWEATFTRR